MEGGCHSNWQRRFVGEHETSLVCQVLTNEEENGERWESRRRHGLRKKNTGQEKRKKPQKGRMSVRTGGWEVKKMTQRWREDGGQDR